VAKHPPVEHPEFPPEAWMNVRCAKDSEAERAMEKILDENDELLRRLKDEQPCDASP